MLQSQWRGGENAEGGIEAVRGREGEGRERDKREIKEQREGGG